jgi:hypothetical protein
MNEDHRPGPVFYLFALMVLAAAVLLVDWGLNLLLPPR